MARSAWYKLDNVGKFYAAQAGRGGQTVFRFSATMVDPVDPVALQSALYRTIERYPGFNVKLRSGIFWHYLEPAGNIPSVQPESLPICAALHADLNSVLYRVNYFGARINLEVSHMISDGRGTLEFFRALLAFYVEERYGAPADLPDPAVEERRTEDSYTSNFEREKAGSDPKMKVYQLRGFKNKTEPTYMEYHLSASAVHRLAKSMGVSVTCLVVAAVIVAIRDTMPARERDRAIRMDIPVDLRGFFESETLRNFFGLAYVAYIPGKDDESLEQIAQHVQDQISQATQPDVLKRRMNQMLKIEKNHLIQAAPLFLKDGGLMIGNWMAAREVTATVSSIGRIKLEPSTEPYVSQIDVLTSPQGLNFLFCTFGDVLSITISSIFVNHALERGFCRVFTDQGILGTLSINRSAAQVNSDLQQARWERLPKGLEKKARKRAKKHARKEANR